MCSAGDRPAGVRIGSPVARRACAEGNEALKPLDKAIHGMVSKSSGRNESERVGGPESE